MSYLDAELKAENVTRFLEKLSRDCSNDQFIREFTKNGIEAIEHYRKITGDYNYKGEVIIQTNSLMKELDGSSKICFIDNGIGMTHNESMNYIRSMAESSDYKKESGYENFGLGAKISAITRNKRGVSYDSWQSDDNRGTNVTLHYDYDRDTYTVAKHTDGSNEYYFTYIDEAAKQKKIDKNGTIVTLMGNGADDDTYDPVTHHLTKVARNTWVAMYLNKRFYCFPDNITVRAEVDQYREDANGKSKAYLCEIKGLKKVIESYAIASGSLDVTDATIKWYILEKDRPGHAREFTTGHTAIIFEDEVFDISSGMGNMAIKFGIPYGYQDIVIHVFPKGKKFMMDSTRENVEMQLDTGRRGLPWENWQSEFYQNMPQELAEYIKKISDSFTKSDNDAMKKRLKEIEKFFSLGKFRKKNNGNVNIEQPSISDLTGFKRIGEPKDNPKPAQTSSSGYNHGSIMDYLSVISNNNNLQGDEVTNRNPFPEVIWSTNDGSGVDEGELDERAAIFRPKNYQVIANQNFQGFVDLYNYFQNEFPSLENDEIERQVRIVFEQQLMETIAGAQALKNRRKWNPKDYETATSAETLTAVCMVRYHQMIDIKRKLSQISKEKGDKFQKALHEESD